MNSNLRNLNIPTFGDDLTNLSARNTYRDGPSEHMTINNGEPKNSTSRQSHPDISVDVTLSSRHYGTALDQHAVDMKAVE